MKQFAVVGLGSFGKRMVEELSRVNTEVMLIDRDQTLVEQYKDKVAAAYVADAFHEDVIRKLVPASIDAAIVDLGGRIEVSVLVTNYLKKIGIETIIARAESDEHGEILELVGATQVIFPTREAAKRVTPLLVSSELFNYLPISNGLVIAEVKTPRQVHGLSLIEADLRRSYGINIIAIRKEDQGEFDFVPSDYHLNEKDVLLVVGKEQELTKFSGIAPAESRNGNGTSLLRMLFGRKNRKG